MKSGVYKITNTVTGKFYIGSSKDLKRREATHLQRLNKNNHVNIHLQRAYNINKESFIFEIIEYCSPLDLIQREQFWIDSTLPNYNISPTAYSSLGIVRREETKEKIRNSLLGRKSSKETRDKQSKSLRGQKRSPEICNKMSLQQMGNNNSLIKSGKGFDIQIRAMMLANTGKKRDKSVGEKIALKLSKPIIQLSLNNEFIKEWDSANQVERELGFSNSLINRVCTGKIPKQGWIHKTAYGYKWKFKTNYNEDN